ncbi:hypothetical protein GS8_1368 [Geobacillus stearothermophilus]|uniref:Uncharacterized protein n=1 Tax=Geobacillus stearothermophilus TaxID=1422 RepID=A0ABQ7HGJ5_GEOSE|nr:hypothetical protein GS8_1368 [Geobacillus stearothermophilus]
MEQWILWALAAVGIGLLGLSFRFLPPREVWLSFLLNSYAASFFGSIVAGAGLLEYPVRFFASYTNNSVIFEYLSGCQCVRLCHLAPSALAGCGGAMRGVCGGADGP